MQEELLQLLNKFDVPTPRYTSYPTVPFWEPDTINPSRWLESVKNMFVEENGELSIYIHLPYCENLCTFCACNKRITKNHNVEARYIEAVLKEWKMYKAHFPSQPIIREIHLGGGTPTFFSPENLTKLIKGITADCNISDSHEFSVEVHPNYTKAEHLVALSRLGFNRISLGVQDFDPEVQFIINRMQSFEKTKEVVDWSRKYGLHSINIDLVYGLPKQTQRSVEMTVEFIKELQPDRIAFYSYAHVPWKSKGQRRYAEAALPSAQEKWQMYHRGRGLLMMQGFVPIGMDHFALPDDKLFKAAAEGKMHRNFMGYTTTNNKLIVGLGCSSISDSWTAFVQNEKEVEAYEEKIENGNWTFITGHALNKEDLILRKNILELMCNGKTTIENALDQNFLNVAFDKLKQLAGDGLLELENNTITVTDKGQLFIRNISAALDARWWRKSNTEKTFSKAI
ncbi:MAG TPA: oxygen-independent coproporphyrinogen III oxidase [Cyclobacteriaceae bacterium]|nr:oxygen-independent coproporphyrinogen III oxidase [Cyclobacteriaceae bacterium]